MELTKEELDKFIQYLREEEIERRCEDNGVLKELRRINQHKKHEWFNRLSTEDLTPYPYPTGFDELVEKGVELSAKGYKMRQELVREGDKYFIVFEK